MFHMQPTLMALVCAAAPALLAAETDTRWTIARAGAAPAVIEAVEPALPPQRGTQAFKVTIANTSGATLEQVSVMVRVFTSAGTRRAFFVEWHSVIGLPGARVVLTLRPKPGALAPGDQVVVTLGQVRYGDATRSWDWRIDQVELLKLSPSMTTELAGRTILLPAALAGPPEPDLAMCDMCAATAGGICGHKPNSAGTCNRPGCIASFSCKIDSGCEVTCRDDDACC